MNRLRNILLFSLPLFALTILTTCGEDIKLYTLTIDGYKANFTGYYYVDGRRGESFSGELEYTDSYGYNTYYCEVDLDDFDSIKVYAFKTSAECALTVTLWKDGKEVATVSSSSNEVESYDDDSGTYIYVMSLEPLYYESTDDDDDDDDDDS